MKGEVALLDQYYTKSNILRKIVPICTRYLKEYGVKTVVDFSCGSNEFLHLLANNVSGVELVGYDICPPDKTFQKVVKRDFLTIKRDVRKKPVACALNPPYGPSHQYIYNFIEHSLHLYNPCLFFLIIPLEVVKRLSKSGLHCLDMKVLPENAFYVENGRDFKYPTCFCVLSTAVPDDMKVVNFSSTIIQPVGYDISSSMNVDEAHILYRTSGRHAGEDIIGKLKDNSYLFLRYDGSFHKATMLKSFKNYRDGTSLTFERHWIKIKFHRKFQASSKLMESFLLYMKDNVKDPERNLKSPPSIRKEFIIKFLNDVFNK
jgi:predicted RNA methylase